MSSEIYKWEVTQIVNGDLCLVCVPQWLDGEKEPYELVAWKRDTFSQYYGQITILPEGETIDLTDDDLINLLSRMQEKTDKLRWEKKSEAANENSL